MKKLLFIALSFLIFSCNPEVYKTGKESDIGGDLNGKVKKYSLKYYNATSSFDEIIKESERDFPFWYIATNYHLYDKKGNLSERSIIDGSKLIFEYDKNENRLGYKLLDNNGNISVVWQYEYDSKRNNVKSLSYSSNGDLNYYTRNLYNSQGQNYLTLKYSQNGDLVSKIERGFDDLGYEIEVLESDNNELLKSKNTYSYDTISKKKINKTYFINKEPIKPIVPQIISNGWKNIEIWNTKKTFSLGNTESEIPWSTSYRYEAYRALYKKYAPELSEKEREKKVLYAGNRQDQDEMIRAFYNKYTGSNPSDRALAGVNRYINPEFNKKMYTKLSSEYSKQKKIYKEALIEYENKLKTYNDGGVNLTLQDKIIFDYNDKGDLILENKNDELKEYKYDYDEYENWIVKYEYLYGKIKYISERTIEYYK